MATRWPFLYRVVRPERFELPTPKFVAWCSIQLSYGRAEAELWQIERESVNSMRNLSLAESEG